MFTIYGRNGCPWCVKAEQLLSYLSVPYVYRNGSTHPEYIDWLKAQGFMKVPQIFIGEVHIGGYSDLVPYLRKVGYYFDEELVHIK
jgi:glutaredoxin